METLNISSILPYIIILIGLAFVLIGLFSKSTTEKFSNNGALCEGIIFALGYRDTIGPRTDTLIKDKITVRFVTNKQEWITEDLDTSNMILWTGQFKEGQKVSVKYDPVNPKDFALETKQSPIARKLLFAAVGILFIGVGIYKFIAG